MTRARRRHPALARKIDELTTATNAPGVRIAIITAPCGCMAETDGFVATHRADCSRNPDKETT